MNTGYFKSLVMGNVFGTDKEPSIPTHYFIGLFKQVPSDAAIKDGSLQSSGADKGIEPSGGGYQRVDITNLLNTPTMNSTKPYDVTVSNKANIQFPRSTTDWFPTTSRATHYGIFDAQTGDQHLLMYNSLTDPRTIEKDTIAIIETNSLQLKLLDK